MAENARPRGKPEVKPLVILNPRSQGGRTGKQAAKLISVLQRYIGEVDRIDTEQVRHASLLAENATEEGRTILIAVGGDGTVSEVCNGLMKAHQRGLALPKLGIIGQGTGGDFRRTLNIEHRLDRYCEVIAAGKTRSIDMGRLRYTDREGKPSESFFVNILSAGLSGFVDHYMATTSRRLGGTAAYFGASLKALAKSEASVIRCTLTLGQEQSVIDIPTRVLAICNGRYFGGGMEIAPMAEPDDGVFHLVSLGDAPRMQFFLSSLSVYRGAHLNKPNTQVYDCNSLTLDVVDETRRSLFPLDVDGEPLGFFPLQVDVVSRAIDVFVNDQA